MSATGKFRLKEGVACVIRERIVQILPRRKNGNQGMSVRRISKETGYSRSVVREALSYDENRIMETTSSGGFSRFFRRW